MSDTKPYKTHLFICTFTRESGASCGSKNSAKLRDETKKNCGDKLNAYKGEFRVNAAGCLGKCEEGIAAVLYPQGKWFTGLSADLSTSFGVSECSSLLTAEVEKSLKK